MFTLVRLTLFTKGILIKALSGEHKIDNQNVSNFLKSHQTTPLREWTDEQDPKDPAEIVGLYQRLALRMDPLLSGSNTYITCTDYAHRRMRISASQRMICAAAVHGHFFRNSSTELCVSSAGFILNCQVEHTVPQPHTGYECKICRTET